MKNYVFGAWNTQRFDVADVADVADGVDGDVTLVVFCPISSGFSGISQKGDFSRQIEFDSEIERFSYVPEPYQARCAIRP